MRRYLLQPKRLISVFTLCASFLFALSAGAQTSTDEVPFDPSTFVVPEPRTITAALPKKAPERVVELYFFDADNHICVDTYKLTLSKSVIVRNNPVGVRVRISRKCDDRVKTAPVPLSAVLSLRSGNKSGASETIRPDSAAFGFTTSFPSAGNWQVTVVSKYDGTETHTVSLPVNVLAEPPVVEAAQDPVQ